MCDLTVSTDDEALTVENPSPRMLKLRTDQSMLAETSVSTTSSEIITLMQHVDDDEHHSSATSPESTLSQFLASVRFPKIALIPIRACWLHKSLIQVTAPSSCRRVHASKTIHCLHISAGDTSNGSGWQARKPPMSRCITKHQPKNCSSTKRQCLRQPMLNWLAMRRRLNTGRHLRTDVSWHASQPKTPRPYGLLT